MGYLDISLNGGDQAQSRLDRNTHRLAVVSGHEAAALISGPESPQAPNPLRPRILSMPESPQ